MSSYPLSLAQREIFREALLFPASAVHTVASQSIITGPIDKPLLAEALVQLFQRHVALRLSPIIQKGVVLDRQQEVRCPDRLLSLHDVSAEPDAWQSGLSLARALGQRSIPFNGDVTFRFDLIRISDTCHIWVGAYHHINMDAWANGILMRELAELYSALVAGRPPCWSEFVDYRMCIDGDQAHLDSDRWSKNAAFWGALHDRAPERLVECPPTFLRSVNGALPTRLVRRQLPSSLVERLRAFGTAAGVGLNQVFTLGILAVLGKQASVAELAFGMSVLNRRNALEKNTFGLFSLVVAPKIEVMPDDTVNALLAKLEKSTKAAMRHSRYALSQLNRQLASQYGQSVPLFDVNISYERVDFGVLPFGLAEMGVPTVLLNGVERNPVELFIRDYGDQRQVEIDLEVSATLFDERNADALADRYVLLLERLLDCANEPLSGVSLLEDSERDWLVNGVNETAQDFGPFVSVLDRVMAQAQKSPAAIALSSEQGDLGYADLVLQAKGIAQRLQRSGVQPGDHVAIYLERSPDLVVALLGTWMAGAVYVPLDPDYPLERLGFMLTDSQASIVLTHSGLVSGLPASDAKAIVVDDVGRSRGARSALFEPVSLAGSDVAYILYTSGSTGQPKGVVIDHGGLHNRLCWAQAQFGLDSSDCVLQKTPYSFDVSVWEFFWPLMSGSRLHLARPGGHRDPDYLAQVIAEQGVTLLHFVPSMLQSFVGHVPASFLSKLSSIRHILCSGEALTEALVRRSYAVLPDTVTLHNLYGPTEASIDVSYWRCDRQAGGQIPIGYPVANTRLYVLDDHQGLVPAGLVGELWISGVQLAQGYWNRPFLTADCFVSDPYSTEPGARMYRTGDRVRRLSSGALEYLGRGDSQIKLRGMRIELGEIDALVLTQSGVLEAASYVWRSEVGDERLLCAVVLSAQADLVEIQSAVARYLPAHMVPSDWIELSSLPVSPSGKLDRNALPGPERDRASVHVKPRDEEEALCCNVFASVLGLDAVGVDDNFFALGGHSLLAVQVVGQLRDSGGLSLSPSVLFGAPTPALLALSLKQTSNQPLKLIGQASVQASSVASDAEHAIWFFQSRHPESSAYHMGVDLQIQGDFQPAVAHQALLALVQAHPKLHSCYVDEAGTLVIRPITERLSSTPPPEFIESTDAAKLAFYTRPFDLSQASPIRWAFVRRSKSVTSLYLVIHHIACDAYSLNILARQFSQLYRALGEKGSALASDLVAQWMPVSAVPERLTEISNTEHSQCFDWELQALSQGAENVRGLRECRSVSAIPERHTVGLAAHVVDQLRTLAARYQTTPFAVVQAALALAILRRTQGQQVTFGVPYSLRRDWEESQVGMRLNTVPLGFDFSEVDSVADCLRLSAQLSKRAAERASQSLASVVEQLDSFEGDLIEVLLTAHPGHMRDLVLADLDVDLQAIPAQAAKAPLSISVLDDDGAWVIEFEADQGLFAYSGLDSFACNLLSTIDFLANSSGERLLSEFSLIALDSSEWAAELADGSNYDPNPLGDLRSRFADQASQYPSCVALEHGENQLTYAALDTLTDRYAAVLQSRGAESGHRIGIYTVRGVEQIACFLAVIKLGGAYVPLDPQQPQERLLSMVADAGIDLVIFDRHPLQGFSGAQIALAEFDGSESVYHAPQLNSDPNECAYLMFTSGSTGTPKGIAIPHRAIMRLAIDPGFAQFYPGKRIGQIATTAFDAATYEIWCALLNGGTAVLIDSDALYTPDALTLALRRSAIDSMFLTAAVFHRCAAATSADLSQVPEVIVGGDRVDVSLIREAKQRWPDTRFVNGYGPTETTTFAATFDFAQLGDRENAPIGYPLRATSLYVLDSDLRPVPRGVAGELFIGGLGVALGYLNRPEDTAYRFLPDPFSGEVGARMYRTGDRVRRLPDGALDYLGRLDRQIKLRGYRIELGEVEAALRDISQAKEVVVDIRSHGGDSALYAWVVPAESDCCDPSEWRRALAERLPAWMLPRSIVLLPALPLNANGKVVLEALSLPETSNNTSASDLASQTERVVSDIWTELIGGGPYARDDHFFGIGGHSLLAVKFLAEVDARCGVSLPIKTLFTYPRLVDFAAAIDAAGQISMRPKLTNTSADFRHLPVSDMAQRLLLLNQIEGDISAYTVPIVQLFDGVLDSEVLQRAWHDVVRSQSSLSAAYALTDTGAKAYQLQGDMPAIEHCSVMPGMTLQAAVDAHLRAVASIGFDLATDWPWRLYYFVIGQTSAVVLVCHHIAVDGQSIPVLVQALAESYSRHLFKGEGQSGIPNYSYWDWVDWQTKLAATTAHEASLAATVERLATVSHELVLPADGVRSLKRSVSGAIVEHRFAPHFEDVIAEAARQYQVTPFAWMLSAYALLLSRIAGVDALTIGIPVDRRAHPDLAETVGFFVDTAVVPIVLDSTLAVGEFVAETHRAVNQALTDPVPFSAVLDAMSVARDTSRTPLFQVMLAYTEAEQLGHVFGDIQSRPYFGHMGTAKFDLQLQVVKEAGTLALGLEYASDLFYSSTAQGWLDRYVLLLERLLDCANEPLSGVSLLEDSERDWLVNGVNETAQDFGPFVSVLDRIMAQAQKSPAAIAVSSEQGDLGYADLVLQAKGIAQRLQRSGVQPGDHVAIYLERSPDLVVALLGTWMAGAVYVPLDPDYPLERLGFMLTDSQASIVLTHSGLVSGLPASDAKAIVVDEVGRSRGARSALFEPVSLAGSDVAYILYTSGSTGQPKGVVIDHGGLHNRLCWAQAQFGLDSSDCVLQKTPYSFDVSVWEFFWPLMSGSRLHLARPGGHRDPDYLAQVIAEQGVTLLHFVPSMLQSFVGHVPASFLSKLSSIRHILCSGEALTEALVRRSYAVLPDTVTLHNLYGPTEASIDVSYWRCDRQAGGQIPIGYPVANTRLYVLDDHQGLVPAGLVGDLWISGVQLAQGYWNRPLLTADCFVSDPYSTEPGARMYRTGDRVRRLSSGALEYLGRGDSQIKLRGMRIELGEIDALVLTQSGVLEAASYVWRSEVGDERLLCAVVLSAQADLVEIQSAVARYLPAHMVPSDWVELSSLPVSPSGKLDRNALPGPDRDRASVHVKPRDEEEALCCNVFASVLGLDAVGVDDNFFALGGHSLLAVQVVGQLRQALSISLEANGVFTAPTPRLLAETLRARMGIALTDLAARENRFSLTPSIGQEQMWFLDQLDGAGAYNVPDIFELHGALNTQALEQAVIDVLNKHWVLRTLYHKGDELKLVLAPAEQFILQCDSGEHLDTQQRNNWCHQKALEAFDLSHELPIKMHLLALGEQRHLLAIVMHHIVTDGASAKPFYDDLSKAYEARVLGEAPRTEDLPYDYFDWALAQRAYLRSDAFELDLAQRLEHFNALPEPLSLPTLPQAKTAKFEGAQTTIELGGEFLNQVKALAIAQRSTTFMVFSAALVMMLERLSGQSDIVVGVPTSGRDRKALDDLVGYFVNTIPVRFVTDGCQSYGDILQMAKAALLQGYRYQKVPLHRLIQAMDLDRTRHNGSLFRVLFAQQSEQDQGLQLTDLKAESYVHSAVAARFDLSFIIEIGESHCRLFLHYNRSLFSADQANQFGHYFQDMTRVLCQKNPPSLDQLSLLNATSQAYLDELYSPEVAHPLAHSPAENIRTRFAKYVAQSPNAIAVESGENRLTYQALDELASRYAQALLDLGVKPGDRLGVYTARGIEQIALFLAAIKLGSAYVPLDPDQPNARMLANIQDADIECIVFDDRRLLDFNGRQINVLDLITTSKSTLPELIENTEECAYIMFTSGSTGRPKGIAVPHRAIVSLAIDPGFGQFDEGVRIAQIATTAFDAATYEIWCALLNGGTCVIVDKEARFSPEALANALIKQKIESLFLTTALMHALAQSSVKDLGMVREIYFGGERASPAVLQSALLAWPNLRLVHVYGPTETCTFASFYELAPSPYTDVLPIGYPLRATQLYVLDANALPVPRGVTGELYIGGAGLALGYVGLPDETEKRFVSDPFKQEPGALMYRTGDTVRRLPNGALEYIGRIDRQVKVRGHRIELAEVEWQLLAVSGAKAAVVDVRGEAEALGLYAWVAPDKSRPSTPTEWQQKLRQNLPHWMLPRSIILVDSLPLNANGKVDLTQLSHQGNSKVIPYGDLSLDYQTPLETMVGSIWSQLLGNGPYSRSDNFFGVGGHSLLGVRLVSMIQASCGVELALKALFECSTLADVATLIERQQTAQKSTGKPAKAPIQRRRRRSEQTDV